METSCMNRESLLNRMVLKMHTAEQPTLSQCMTPLVDLMLELGAQIRAQTAQDRRNRDTIYRLIVNLNRANEDASRSKSMAQITQNILFQNIDQWPQHWEPEHPADPDLGIFQQIPTTPIFPAMSAQGALMAAAALRVDDPQVLQDCARLGGVHGSWSTSGATLSG